MPPDKASVFSKNAGFARRIIGADLCADMGNQFAALSLLDLLVFKGENMVANLVILALIHHLPSILLSPLAGAGIDRIGPKYWLFAVNGAKCVLAGALAAVTGRWIIFPIYFLFMTASLFFSIGRLSMVALKVPAGGLIAFNALNERIAIAGAVFSPWLTGLVIAHTRSETALLISALFFAVSVLLIAGIRGVEARILPESPSPVFRTGILGRIWVKKRSFRNNTGFENYFFMLGVVILGGGILNLGLPIHFKTHIGSDIAGWGLVMSAFQAGAFLAACLLPRAASAFQREKVPAAGFLVLGAAIFILPFARNIIFIALLTAFLGCGFSMLQLYWESRIQQTSDRSRIGQAMSNLTAFRGACYLGTILAGAMITSLWGAPSFMMIGSCVVGSAFFMTGKSGRL